MNGIVQKDDLKGTSPRIKKLNSYLDQVYFKLQESHKRILDKDNLLTADMIKAFYQSLDEEHKTLNDLIEYHNENKGCPEMGNAAKYRQEFLRKKKKISDIYLKHMNYQFITEFEMFLKNYRAKRKTCGTNGTMKHLERLKKLLNLSIKLEWLEKNPF